MRERLFIVVLALAAFGAAVSGGFYLDDLALWSDPAITSPKGWMECFQLSQTRPLTWLSFWMNYQAAGENPTVWHAVNLLIHLACVLLVFDTLRRVVPPSVAMTAASLFALHPIQTEAVAYVFARATLLMTLFCVASLREWFEGRYWRACFWFALALLAKEECVAFPLFLMLLHVSGGRSKEERPAMGAMLVLSIAAGARVLWATSVMAGAGAGAQAGVTPVEYLFTQGVVIWRYVRMLLVPYGLTIDPDIALAPAWLGLTGWAAIAGCLWVIRRNKAAMWLFGALVLLAPSSSILPAQDLAADRRMYLPLIALGVVVGLWLERRPRWIGIALALTLALISFRQSLIWSSGESLWKEAVRVAPNKIRPRIQLARQLPPAEALPVLDAAKSLAPNNGDVASERGRVLLETGNTGAALAEFGRALAIAPNDARAMNNRGVALLKLGQQEPAIADFRRALDREPCLFDAQWNLRNLGIRSDASASCRFTLRQQELLQQAK